MIHDYLIAFVKRRQQATEFSTKYADYLKEDIATSQAYNTIQLVLVCTCTINQEIFIVRLKTENKKTQPGSSVVSSLAT